jgi:hypothetical protein
MYSKYQSLGLWCPLALSVETNISEESAASAFKDKVADYVDKLQGGSTNGGKGTVSGLIQWAQWTAKLSIQICHSLIIYFSTSHFMWSNPIGLDKVSFLSNHLWSPIASCLHTEHKQTPIFNIQLEAGCSCVTLISVDKPTWHRKTKHRHLNLNTSFKTKYTSTLQHLISHHPNAFDLLPQRKQSAKLEAGGWKSVRNCYLFTLTQCVVLKRNWEYSGRSNQISPENRRFCH